MASEKKIYQVTRAPISLALPIAKVAMFDVCVQIYNMLSKFCFLQFNNVFGVFHFSIKYHFGNISS